MKALLLRAAAHPRYSAAIRWGKLLSVIASAQMLIQGLGFLSGFLVIHMLSTHEYGLYTLAYAMLGTITTLADAGIGSGVMASGGRVWQDRAALSGVLATGMSLRRKFALATFAISLPVLLYMLVRHDAGWLTASLIILALIPAFVAMLTQDLLAVPLRLHQDVTPLQKNDLLGNAGRLVILAGGLFLFPLTVVAVLANGLPRIWANMQLRRLASRFVDLSAPPDPVAQKEILAIVKRTLPGTIYYCVSGQISVWLISIYGNTSSIAEIGALGRLSALLTVLGAVWSTVVTPRFARLPANSKLLLSTFLKIFAAVTLLVILIPALVYLFPTQVLYILGRSYASLTTEVVLSALGGCMSMMVGWLYAISLTRGWVMSPVISITLSIVVQIVLILLLNLSSTTNVLIYAILNSAWGLVMYSGYFFYKIAELRKQELAAAEPSA